MVVHMPVRNVRRRYLCFTIESDVIVKEKELWEIIQSSIHDLYGLKGLSIIEPNLIEYNTDIRKGILRCNYDTVRCLRGALAYITSIKSKAATIRVWKISGTLKSLRHNIV